MQPIAVQPGNWLAVAAAFGLLELLLQLGMMTLCPFKPIGDEVDYIAHGRSNNPFRFRHFFRVPLLPAVAWFGARTGHPATFLRSVSAVLSALAMAATAGAATRMGGTVIASVLCVALLVVPERIVLGSRIWPDVYLAAAASAIVASLTLTPSPVDPDQSAAVIGILVTFAILTRLDALVLIPSVAVTWAMTSPTMSPTQLGWLTGLPLSAFALWWLVSILIFKQRWPDTTWIFNLGIAAQEAKAQHENNPITIDDLIQRHQVLEIEQQQLELPKRESIPWAGFLLSVSSRFRAMVGVDTFVQGKILANHPTERPWGMRRVLNALLRSSVPFAVATSLVIFSLPPRTAYWLAVPAISLMVPAVLFHARTRFRLPLIYVLVPVLAASLGQMLTHPRPFWTLLIIIVLVGLLTVVLSATPRRLESR